MKRILIVLSVILIASLSSCLRNDEEKETTGTTTPEAETTTLPPVTTAPTEIITLTTTTTTTPEILPDVDYENPIVMTAEALMGIDFATNGASPTEGFDNSGFIYYVLRENGYIGCPRHISEQVEWGPTTDYDSLKAGDVAYFSDEPGGNPTFGGIYAGGGIMIYSPFPGEKVKKADITAEYWKSRFVTALSL